MELNYDSIMELMKDYFTTFSTRAQDPKTASQMEEYLAPDLEFIPYIAGNARISGRDEFLHLMSSHPSSIERLTPEDIMVEPISERRDELETEVTSDAFQIHLPKDGLGLEEAERQFVIQALMRTGWIQKDAADLLKINKRMMHYKVRKYGIDIPKMKSASSN